MSLQARKALAGGLLLLSPDEWHVIDGVRPAGTALATNSAYREFTVVNRPDEGGEVVRPALNGHTVVKQPYLNGFGVSLCVAAAFENRVSPERFLYVVEVLDADQEWRWLEAWHPTDLGERDLRCAYVVTREYFTSSSMSAPDTFQFRPMVIRSDGTRWRGPVRVVSIEDAAIPTEPE